MPPAESADESEERGCGECSGEPWTFVVHLRLRLNRKMGT